MGMNIQKTEGYLSEAGEIHKTKQGAVKASYKKRIDDWILSLPNPGGWLNREVSANFIHIHCDELARLLKDYPLESEV